LEAKATDEAHYLTWVQAIAYAFGLDWHLPTKDELNQLYLQQTVVGGFANNFYRSSTEYDSKYAWYQYFGNGSQDYVGSKNNQYSVRAVRTF